MSTKSAEFAAIERILKLKKTPARVSFYKSQSESRHASRRPGRNSLKLETKFGAKSEPRPERKRTEIATAKPKMLTEVEKAFITSMPYFVVNLALRTSQTQPWYEAALYAKQLGKKFIFLEEKGYNSRHIPIELLKYLKATVITYGPGCTIGNTVLTSVETLEDAIGYIADVMTGSKMLHGWGINGTKEAELEKQRVEDEKEKIRRLISLGE